MEKKEGYLSRVMNARKFGSGEETLILTHGYGADQNVWDKVLPTLAQSYQVVVFDWCFSGAVIKDNNKDDDDVCNPLSNKYSSYEGFVDDLIALLEELNLTSSSSSSSSCSLVAHSMSGIVGCIASIRKPHLFKSLILVASSPRFLNSDDYEGGFEKPDIDQMFINIESNFDQWTSAFAKVAVDQKDPASIEYFQKCVKRMGSKVALAVAKTVFLSDYTSVLDKVVVPCTLIHSKDDFAVPISVVNFMQSNIKSKSTVKIVEAVGHFPQLTAHQQFLDALLEALA